MKRLLFTVTATLLLAACSATGGEPTGTAAAAADATEITVRDMTIEPGELSVSTGVVTLAVTNEGPTPHNVRIRDADGNVLFGTRDLRRGEAETTSGTLEPGEYTMFCSLPGHESLGVVGTLTVTEP